MNRVTVAAVAVLATAASLGTAATTTAATAATGPAPAKIGALPTGATYDRSEDVARVRVAYTCTNATGQQHYLSVQLAQTDRPSYNKGLRGDNGGTLLATCTGTQVRQTITLVRTSYADPEGPGLRNGRASLTVSLLPRSTPENGGVYVATGEDVVRKGTLTVTRRA